MDLRERIASSPFHVWSGITLDEMEPGRVVMSMTIAPEHLNPQGFAHGGVIAALLDSVCGMSLRTLLVEGEQHQTIQLNINFLRGARGGERLTGSGRALHSGRSTGYSEGEIRDAQDRLVARATGTFLKLR